MPQRQCPNPQCGRFMDQSEKTYISRETGESVSDGIMPGCLLGVGAWLALFVLIDLIIYSSINMSYGSPTQNIGEAMLITAGFLTMIPGFLVGRFIVKKGEKAISQADHIEKYRCPNCGLRSTFVNGTPTIP